MFWKQLEINIITSLTDFYRGQLYTYNLKDAEDDALSA